VIVGSFREPANARKSQFELEKEDSDLKYSKQKRDCTGFQFWPPMMLMRQEAKSGGFG
jgi:hypothetical protein